MLWAPVSRSRKGEGPVRKSLWSLPAPITVILRKEENERSRQTCGALGLASFLNQLVWILHFCLFRCFYFYIVSWAVATSTAWEECLGVPPASGLQITGLDSPGDAGAYPTESFQMTSLTLLSAPSSPAHCSSPTGLLAIPEHSKPVFHLKAFALTIPSAWTTLPPPPQSYIPCSLILFSFLCSPSLKYQSHPPSFDCLTCLIYLFVFCSTDHSEPVLYLLICFHSIRRAKNRVNKYLLNK